MITWLTAAFGGDELDARCQRLPPNHHLRHFSRGFTSLSRLTGAEHSDIARFLLGLVIGLPLPGGQSPARIVCALRGLLDFLYLAQYPVHSTETLALLKDALLRFHENKLIFVELGIRQHFNFPKMHALIHYFEIIIWFGTTDNYNTEYAERLHINFTKDAYCATNHKDKFYQMTIWLERKEKIERHGSYIHWRLTGETPFATPDSDPPHRIRMSKRPTRRVLISDIQQNYHSLYICDAIARYIAKHNNPHLNSRQIEADAEDIDLQGR